MLEDDDEAERRRSAGGGGADLSPPSDSGVAGRAGGRRGDLAEATVLHLRFAVEPLVRLLRIQHCPARHDFGLRYLRTDLPAGMADQVEAVLPGPDLVVRTRAAFAWQDEVLRELR